MPDDWLPYRSKVHHLRRCRKAGRHSLQALQVISEKPLIFRYLDRRTTFGFAAQKRRFHSLIVYFALQNPRAAR
jgi:hypothetical protein